MIAHERCDEQTWSRVISLACLSPWTLPVCVGTLVSGNACESRHDSVVDGAELVVNTQGRAVMDTAEAREHVLAVADNVEIREVDQQCVDDADYVL